MDLTRSKQALEPQIVSHEPWRLQPDTVWTADTYRTRLNGSSPYAFVESLPAKTRLDSAIATLLIEVLQENSRCRVIEFFGGSGPVSQLLYNHNPNSQCIVADLKPSTDASHRTRYLPTEKKQGYLSTTLNIEVNLANPCGVALNEIEPNPENAAVRDTLSGVDAAVMVNGWYAVTSPPREQTGESAQRLTTQEALLLRHQVLLNAAQVIKSGGTLIISDPLASARSLNTKEGKKKAISAQINAMESSGKSRRQQMLYFLQNIFRPQVKTILQENSRIVQEAHLFDSVHALVQFVTETGLFRVDERFEPRTDDYLGHNATVVFRRTEMPIINPLNICSYDPSTHVYVPPTSLDSSEKVQVSDTLRKIVESTLRLKVYVASATAKAINVLLSKYRQLEYSWVNPAIGVDRADVTGEHITAVVYHPNSVIPVGSLDLRKPNDGTDFDVAHLLRGPQMDFLSSLQRTILDLFGDETSLNFQQIAEARRLATSKQLWAIFPINGIEIDSTPIQQAVIMTLVRTLKESSKGLRYVIFVSQDRIARLLREPIRAFGMDFQTASEYHLRITTLDAPLAAVYLSGADYFLGRNWLQKISKDTEVQANILYLRTKLHLRRPDNTVIYTTIRDVLSDIEDSIEREACLKAAETFINEVNSGNIQGVNLHVIKVSS